jgi:hypothetical protein
MTMTASMTHDAPPVKRTRGLWFDEKKQRWRVRLYKNGKAYLPKPKAYFETREEAETAFRELKRVLATMNNTREAHSTDLQYLWRQMTAAQRHQRIELKIAPENIP